MWGTTPGNSTHAVTGNLLVMSPGVSTSTLKFNTALRYKVGYSYKQNTTALASLGNSPSASQTVLDGANILQMAGLAAALTALAF